MKIIDKILQYFLVKFKSYDSFILTQTRKSSLQNIRERYFISCDRQDVISLQEEIIV
jgi:hypothetical protein